MALAQAVERALTLLALVSDEGGSVTELARRIGVDKSTASRIVAELVSSHYLRRTRDGSLSVGPGVVRLARRYLAGHPLLRACQPALAELQRETGETILLVEPLDVESVICVAKMDSQQLLRIEGEVGARLPLFSGASGKAILAFLPELEVDAALMHDSLPRYGPRSPASAAEVREQLALARSQGYSFSLEELHAGVAGVAAPIFDPDGRPIAALSVVAPVARMDGDRQEQFADALRRAIPEIRRRL